MLWIVLVVMLVVVIEWMLLGFSLTFSGGNGFIGDLKQVSNYPFSLDNCSHAFQFGLIDGMLDFRSTTVDLTSAFSNGSTFCWQPSNPNNRLLPLPADICCSHASTLAAGCC